MMINRDSTFGVKWSEVAVNLLDRWQELVSGKRLDSWSSIGHLFARDIAVILWPSLYRQGLVQRGLLEGKMFGLLLAQQGNGKHLPERDDCYLSLAGGYVLLFAYSGQINGVWNWPGWSPSPSDLQLTAGESWRVQRDLHMLTQRINVERLRTDSKALSQLKAERKLLSRSHATSLRRAVTLYVRQGNAVRLDELWPDAPTGVGECCGPKLISQANQLGIKPLGLAEFTTSSSSTLSELRIEQRLTDHEEVLYFYHPCVRWCRPLMSHLVPE